MNHLATVGLRRRKFNDPCAKLDIAIGFAFVMLSKSIYSKDPTGPTCFKLKLRNRFDRK